MAGVERPLIGFTTEIINSVTNHPHRDTYAGNTLNYQEAIMEAGGEPVPLPLMTVESARSVIDGIFRRGGLHGLIMSGGVDINPDLYEEVSNGSNEPCDIQDATELYILKKAKLHEIPTLLICRGFQLLNVVEGGTLFQHLPDREQVLGQQYVDHSYGLTDMGEERLHEVEVYTATDLGRTLAPNATEEKAVIRVNSRHHQGIDRLAGSLRLVARSVNDKLAEAAEYRGSWDARGVQWHDELRGGRSLIGDLVARCSAVDLAAVPLKVA